jgi:hypothetical protein
MTHIDPYERIEDTFSEARPFQVIETPRNSGRLRRLGNRLALSAICIMPVADVALSDALNVKVVKEADKHLRVASDIAQHAVEDGIVAAFIMGEAVALAEPVRRSRKLKEAGNDFEEYLDERRSQFGGTRRVASNVINAPYNFLFWIGKKTEDLGERIEKSDKATIVKKSGGLVRDLGMVNSVGTTAAILYETADEETPNPSLKREVYLGALFAGSWAVTKELVEGVNRFGVYMSTLPGPYGMEGRSLSRSLDGASIGFDKATGIELTSPLSTPIATTTLGAVALMLGFTGWRVAGYHERKKANQLAETDNQIEAPVTAGLLPVSGAAD